MIIIVGCNKGGVGKTTTATNLAVGLALQGQDICLVDADRQRSSARWHEDREEAEHNPTVTLIEKLNNLNNTLQTLNQKFEHVIVDVAGRSSRELVTGAMVADIILAPHQPSQLDLDTLAELEEQMKRVADFNPHLKVMVYQTMASTNPSVRTSERKSFLEYVSRFSDFIPLQATGYYRKIYKDVIPDGKSVLECENTQAKDEIETLIQELFV